MNWKLRVSGFDQLNGIPNICLAGTREARGTPVELASNRKEVGTPYLPNMKLGSVDGHKG
jgi:hypothetical protein